MSFQNQWFIWKRNCAREFFAQLDESKLISFIENLNKGRSNDSCLGEGADFQTWAVTCGSFQYAVSVQKQGTQPLDPKIWKNPGCLQTIESLTLIPPFRFLQIDGRNVFVTPLGEPVRPSAPMRSLLAVSLDEMLQARLAYKDIFQLRSLDGMPFLIDLGSITAL